MNKKILITIAVIIIVILVILGINSYSSYRKIPEGLSNLKPMYGNTGSVDMRTDRLKELDESFIQQATNNGQTSREDASMYLAITGGWGYYFEKDYETSMKRFNQAWLVNPDNYQAFWGFGLLLMEQKEFDEAITMFESALKLHAENDQIKVLKPWYEKEADESILTKQQLNFKKWIDSMYKSSNSLILCDVGNANLQKANIAKTDLKKQEYIAKSLELINRATNNKTITKNLDNCYTVLNETQNIQ